MVITNKTIIYSCVFFFCRIIIYYVSYLFNVIRYYDPFQPICKKNVNDYGHDCV